MANRIIYKKTHKKKDEHKDRKEKAKFEMKITCPNVDFHINAQT